VTITGFSVQFWGTRGSIATPGPGTVRCGGNTACVEVRCGATVLILDAGTGIRLLGQKLQRENVRFLHLLISHPHVDHLQGFPFFLPAYDPGVDLHIHQAPQAGGPASEAFDRLMEAPHFPVVFRDLPARIRFRTLSAEGCIGPVVVKTHPLNHPGGNLAFRLEYEGKALVYMTDHEPYGLLNGNDPDAGSKDQAILDFTRGADLLIRETQYTAEEYESRRGWGHGTFDEAFRNSVRGGVRRLALFHHDPDHDDDFLEAELARLLALPERGAMEIHLAREGECFHLASGPDAA
jgi:phosphoribosyl 1,2-cyclic phosphodiesterase